MNRQNIIKIKNFIHIYLYFSNIYILSTISNNTQDIQQYFTNDKYIQQYLIDDNSMKQFFVNDEFNGYYIDSNRQNKIKKNLWSLIFNDRSTITCLYILFIIFSIIINIYYDFSSIKNISKLITKKNKNFMDENNKFNNYLKKKNFAFCKKIIDLPDFSLLSNEIIPIVISKQYKTFNQQLKDINNIFFKYKILNKESIHYLNQDNKVLFNKFAEFLHSICSKKQPPYNTTKNQFIIHINGCNKTCGICLQETIINYDYTFQQDNHDHLIDYNFLDNISILCYRCSYRYFKTQYNKIDKSLQQKFLNIFLYTKIIQIIQQKNTDLIEKLKKNENQNTDKNNPIKSIKDIKFLNVIINNITNISIPIFYQIQIFVFILYMFCFNKIKINEDDPLPIKIS